MSEKLTDEQLWGWATSGNGEATSMATELLALRAERAKPTQSDEELARDIAAPGCDCSDGSWTYRMVISAFASIRAEGSAERAKFKAAHKMLGYLLPYCRWTIGPESPGHHPTMPSAVRQAQEAYDAALAQPAESGATELSLTVGEPLGLVRSPPFIAGAKP